MQLFDDLLVTDELSVGWSDDDSVKCIPSSVYFNMVNVFRRH